MGPIYRLESRQLVLIEDSFYSTFYGIYDTMSSHLLSLSLFDEFSLKLFPVVHLEIKIDSLGFVVQLI